MKSHHILKTFLVATALATPIAAAAQDMGPHQWSGVIASVQGSSFEMRDGRHIFMHNGTVINPTGATLRPGMRVTILGSRDGRGRVNANEVDVNHWRRHPNY